MPEIWLRYGSTDVVLDIKFENLLSHVSSTFELLSEEEVRNSITGMASTLTDNMLILGLSSSRAAAKVITQLMELAREKGFANITVDALPDFAPGLRTGIDDPSIPINRADYRSLQDRMKKFQRTIFVSHTTYDPLFGFAGAPTVILRRFFHEKMADAFAARKSNLPAPGIKGGPLAIALSTTASAVDEAGAAAPATCIQLVANSSGFSGIYHGTVSEAFESAVSKLVSMSAMEMEPAKSVIISASSEPGPHSTLSSSLNSLWNCIHVVKENGSAVLVSENREGLGGGVLQLLAEGRYRNDQQITTMDRMPYVEGMEHLVFIEELKKKYELGIVSTLPQYYSRTRLGLSTYSGMKEALEKLLSRNGKTHKVLIVSDPDLLLLKPKT